MKPSWKKVVESVLPPVVTNAYKASRAVRQYRGKYSSWAEAKAASSGYDSPLILEKSVSAMRAVKEGKASYARDGIAFSEPYFPYYLLTMMLRQAALDNGRLSVLDFGGSLGNTYYQCRRLLLGIGNLKWNVVEQETHVRAGNENFSDSQLKFHRTTSECLGDSPNVLLLSSVLQYLEQPFGTLKELLELRPKTVLIDQTPLSLEGEEYLTVQQVPREIYSASYPCWIFSRQSILAFMKGEYELIDEFPSSYQLAPGTRYHGFCFVRK